MRGGWQHIGMVKILLILLSIMMQNLGITQIKVADSNSILYPTISRSKTQIISYNLFPNAILVQSFSRGSETFCVFRNYAAGVSDLGFFSAAVMRNSWKLMGSISGSPALLHTQILGTKTLQVTKKTFIAVGLGLNRDFIQANPFNSAPNGEFQILTPKISISAALGFTHQLERKGYLMAYWLGVPGSNQLQRSMIWNESRVVWMGGEKSGSLLGKTAQSFIGFCQVKGSAFIEGGYLIWVTSKMNISLGLRSNQTPFFIKIININKVWNAGLGLQWHQLLGWQMGLQGGYNF